MFVLNNESNLTNGQRFFEVRSKVFLRWVREFGHLKRFWTRFIKLTFIKLTFTAKADLLCYHFVDFLKSDFGSEQRLGLTNT